MNSESLTPKPRRHPYITLAIGFTFPLLVAWIHTHHFPQFNRGIIFFFLTAPFLIALLFANEIQSKNRKSITHLLGKTQPRDALIVMHSLEKNDSNIASKLAKKYWLTHLAQMYLSGHVYGWFLLIFGYFFRW